MNKGGCGKVGCEGELYECVRSFWGWGWDKVGVKKLGRGVGGIVTLKVGKTKDL